jgi:hypothetical protein
MDRGGEQRGGASGAGVSGVIDGRVESAAGDVLPVLAGAQAGGERVRGASRRRSKESTSARARQSEEIERAADGLRADPRSAGDAEMLGSAAAAAEQGHVERLATTPEAGSKQRSAAVASEAEVSVAEGRLADAERRLMEAGTGRRGLARTTR